MYTYFLKATTIIIIHDALHTCFYASSSLQLGKRVIILFGTICPAGVPWVVAGHWKQVIVI